MSFSNSKLFTLVILLIGLVPLREMSQERRHDEPISDELYSIVLRKMDTIQRQNAGSNDDFVGVYEAGDHHPPVLMWSKDEGFVVKSSLHTFYPSWVNYGRVETFDQFIKLSPVLTAENRSAHIIDSELWKIRWDRQRFLIPRGKLLLFAYAVHSRSDWQIYDYFFKVDTHSARRRGLPQMPAEYRKFLTMTPVVARIKAVGPEKDGWPTITIGAGARDGVIKDMTFYHIRTPNHHFGFRVTEVFERTALAEVSSAGSNSSRKEPKLRVGKTVTSRMPRGFIAPG